MTLHKHQSFNMQSMYSVFIIFHWVNIFKRCAGLEKIEVAPNLKKKKTKEATLPQRFNFTIIVIGSRNNKLNK